MCDCSGWPEELDPVETMVRETGSPTEMSFELVHRSGARSHLSVSVDPRVGVRTGFYVDSQSRHRRPGEGFRPAVFAGVEEDAGRTIVPFGKVRLVVEHRPARVYFEIAGELLCGEGTLDKNVGGHARTFPISRGSADGRVGWCGAMKLEADEAVFGFGEKFTACNKRGQRLVLWNRDAFGVGTEQSYKNVPFFWTTRGYGCLFNTYSRVRVDVGHPGRSLGSLAYFVEGDELDIVWFIGEPRDVIRSYTELTGRGPDVPAWAFGAWISRCYYRSQDEALAVARKFREAGLPCDCITMDGRAWLDVDSRCDFVWCRERVPHPEEFIAELKALGYRLCLWEYPYVSVRSPLHHVAAEKGFFLRDADGRPYVFSWDPRGFDRHLTPLPPSSIVDLTYPAAVEWYKSLHVPLLSQGVDVFKADFGEQVPEDCFAFDGRSGAEIHNEFAVAYQKTVYEVTSEHAEDGGLVFARSGWAGSQRYPVQWGGDSQSSWDGLAFSLRGGLSYSASGVPLWTSDVGGFYGEKPSPELYIRWLQFGAFCPLMRLHGTTPREPWEFGDGAVEAYREYVRLRYRLAPYIFSQYSEARRTGVPVMRHLAIEFPNDRMVHGIDDEYMLGESLLIAPVVSPSGARDVYLPEGLWYDLWTGEAYAGRRALTLNVPLGRMLVFGRHGCAIPLGPQVDRFSEALPRVEELWVFGEDAGILHVDPRLLMVREFDLSDRGSRARLSASGVTSVRLYRGSGVELCPVASDSRGRSHEGRVPQR